LSNPQRAIKILKQAMALQKQIGDKHSKAVVLNNLGEAYLMLKDSKRASECCAKAALIFRDELDARGIAYSLFNGALALDQMGNRDGAIELAKVSLVFYKEINDPTIIKRVKRYLVDWRKRTALEKSRSIKKKQAKDRKQKSTAKKQRILRKKKRD
jgi:tetratricopeptide (TPR) repeat protein